MVQQLVATVVFRILDIQKCRVNGNSPLRPIPATPLLIPRSRLPPPSRHDNSHPRSKQGVGLPRKYLGHGICDARSKLLNLQRATGDAGTLGLSALQLLKEAKVPPDKIRGIGLQMTRLAPLSAAGETGGYVGGGGGGGGSGGGTAGGALHGWLIKQRTATTTEKKQNENAAMPFRRTGGQKDERTVAARLFGADGQCVGDKPPRGARLFPSSAEEECGKTAPHETESSPDLRRKLVGTGRPSPPGLSKKRPREEARTPPQDALHFVGGASMASPGPWVGARAGGAGGLPDKGTGLAVQQKVRRRGPFPVDAATETRLTRSPRNGDAGVDPPGRGNTPVEQAKHEQGVTSAPGGGDAMVEELKHDEEGLSVITFGARKEANAHNPECSPTSHASVHGDDVSPRSSVRRRGERGRELPSESPEILSPSSPADHAEGTPASRTETPSMSQVNHTSDLVHGVGFRRSSMDVKLIVQFFFCSGSSQSAARGV